MAKTKPAADTATEAATAPSATEVRTVTMDDGRIVEFAGKRRVLKASFIDEASGEIKSRFDFENGETRTFTVPASLLQRFAAHGAEQKLGDCYAGLKDTEDCIVAFDELVERLNKGEWAAARESSALAGASVLIKALVEHTGKDAEKIKAYLSTKTQGEKLALRNSPNLAPIVQRIESERAAKKPAVDTAALFAELDASA